MVFDRPTFEKKIAERNRNVDVAGFTTIIDGEVIKEIIGTATTTQEFELL